MVDNQQKARIAAYSQTATMPWAAANQGYTPERGGNLATYGMYSNPITAPLMAVPGVRYTARSLGRTLGMSKDDEPAPYNYGNQAMQPYAQRYGGSVNAAIQQNPDITKEELEQLVMQQEAQAARKAQEDKINAYFADPSRLKRYRNEYDAELNYAKNMLADRTQAGMRSAAQAAASRGIMGGSVDAENRTGLAGQYQSTLADLAQRRTQAGQAQQLQDVQAKTNLMSLVNSNDPFGDQATQAGLQGLAGQGRAAQGWIQAGLNRDLAEQTGANLQSQAIGGGLSSFARGLGTMQDRSYRQGNKSMWGI